MLKDLEVPIRSYTCEAFQGRRDSPRATVSMRPSYATEVRGLAPEPIVGWPCLSPRLKNLITQGHTATQRALHYI